jgi:hypothetical protein
MRSSTMVSTMARIFLHVRMGNLGAAERCIEELIGQSDKHSLVSYSAFGMCVKGGLMAARGDIMSAERFLRTGLEGRAQRRLLSVLCLFPRGAGSCPGVLRSYRRRFC